MIIFCGSQNVISRLCYTLEIPKRAGKFDHQSVTWRFQRLDHEWTNVREGPDVKMVAKVQFRKAFVHTIFCH